MTCDFIHSLSNKQKGLYLTIRLMVITKGTVFSSFNVFKRVIYIYMREMSVNENITYIKQSSYVSVLLSMFLNHRKIVLLIVVDAFVYIDDLRNNILQKSLMTTTIRFSLRLNKLCNVNKMLHQDDVLYFHIMIVYILIFQ